MIDVCQLFHDKLNNYDFKYYDYLCTEVPNDDNKAKKPKMEKKKSKEERIAKAVAKRKETMRRKKEEKERLQRELE